MLVWLLFPQKCELASIAPRALPSASEEYRAYLHAGKFEIRPVACYEVVFRQHFNNHPRPMYTTLTFRSQHFSAPTFGRPPETTASRMSAAENPAKGISRENIYIVQGTENKGGKVRENCVRVVRCGTRHRARFEGWGGLLCSQDYRMERDQTRARQCTCNHRKAASPPTIVSQRRTNRRIC